MASSQPWEQRPDESAKAYAAFLTYRDLGAGRTLGAVAAKHGGRPGGVKRASGRYVKWSSDYEWAVRVRAYDEHLERERQKGVDRASVRAGQEWRERRDKAIREEYQRALLYLRQTDLVASLPTVRQTVERDGRTIVYEPVDLDDLKAAAGIAEKGHGMLWDAIGRGLAIEDAAALRQAGEAAAARPEGDLSEAQRRLDAWRAEQRQRMLTVSPTPPAPDPEPPPAPERNGSHTPPTPASAT